VKNGIKMVKDLLMRGADVSHKAKDGKKAIDRIPEDFK
jgi:hypothetical protein